MSSTDRRRILRFEKLEPKSAPCSLVLLLASPADGAEDAELLQEQYAASVEHCSDSWKHEHTTDQVLRFIRSNTLPQEDRSISQPTDAESAAADEMMKLDDIQLRSLIVFAGMDS